MAEGGPGTTGDVVAALRAVDGVADASISSDRRIGGAGTLHLSLMPGADEVAVATAVNRILREHFGLAVDTDHVSVVDETGPVRLSAVPNGETDEGEGREAEPPEEPERPVQPEHTEQFEQTDPAEPSDVASEATDPWSGYRPGAYGGLASVDPDEPTPGLPWWSLPDPAGEDSEPTEPDESTAAEPEPVAETPVARSLDAESSQDLADEPVRGPRLLIERMQLVAAELGVETEVTLGYGETRWTGRADGAATSTSVHRSVAAATLRAVEQCLGGAVRLELEHLETPPLGVDRAVVVEISMVTRRGAERLTGVSAVREDVRQAVIRATLDALNRRLESHLATA